LEEKVAAPVQKTEITTVGDPSHRLSNTSLSAKVGTNFADKRRSLGRYSSLTDSRKVVLFHSLYGHIILSGQSVKASQKVQERLEIPRLQWVGDVENVLRELNLNRWRKRVNNRYEWAPVVEAFKLLGKQ
jgi:hypothetical protein